jgi:hypothetical protein
VCLAHGLCSCVEPNELSHIYSKGADHSVLCGLTVDNKLPHSNDGLAHSLDRAQAERRVLHLYSHRPAGTVDEATIEEIVGGAADRGMKFVTYRELAQEWQKPTAETLEGLALSFDDYDVDGWYSLREMFQLYDARVTFFVSSFHVLYPEHIAKLHQLEKDGHAIEYHSTNHDYADTYTAELGVERYIEDEILPDLGKMRAEGFDPQVFAYPGGARTGETDVALLQYFVLLRAIHSSCPY